MLKIQIFVYLDFFLYLCDMKRLSIIKSSLLTEKKKLLVYSGINRTIYGVNYFIPILYDTYNTGYIIPNNDCVIILDDIVRFLNNDAGTLSDYKRIYRPFVEMDPTLRYLEQNLPVELV